jgi:hypothetical protein
LRAVGAVTGVAAVNELVLLVVGDLMTTTVGAQGYAVQRKHPIAVIAI